MLSSFLEEISSSGYLRRSASSPKRDSTGGVYSRVLRAEFAFARGCSEAALREGQERLAWSGATLSRTKCSRSRRSSVIPSRNGCPEPKQRPDHVVFGVAETGVVEAHAQRQRAENLDVRARLAGSRQRRPRQWQIVMPVREIEIGVLQERGRRQQNIGVVGRIGLELFQHHGEQILAAQPAQHHDSDPARWRPDSSCTPPSPSPAARPAR